MAATIPMIKRVEGVDHSPFESVKVYTFDGATYKGYSGTSSKDGQVTFAPPLGTQENYRFRGDLNDSQFWSGAENHCTAPGCTTAQIAVPRFGQVTVTTQYRDGEILADLPVYAFSGETYSGISGTSHKEGKVQLWLPEANYHFRADQNKLAFWSGQQDHCTVPGCESVTISTYATGNNPVRQNVITYTYDGLNRLTAAEYDSGNIYEYTYDAVGNRLTETIKDKTGGITNTDSFKYDDANRLIDQDGIPLSWDANGNLLDDGTYIYSYDSANRLTRVVSDGVEKTYAYNGLGDRISKTSEGKTANYILDLNTGLTQVLADGTNTYFYGVERLSQENAEGVDYFLEDALGSVRQLVSGKDQDVKVTLTQDYLPFGYPTNNPGTGKTEYGFTGELQDGDFVHLRARDYSVLMGRFLSRDSWNGDSNQPYSYNKWLYASANPIRFIDSTGHYNREVAVQFANQHDLMDPFDEGSAYRTKTGQTDCAAFASSVLWAGGIRDNREKLLTKDEDGELIDIEPSYWNGEWAQSSSSYYDHRKLTFTSWSEPTKLSAFLMGVLRYEDQIFMLNDENLGDEIRRFADIGDIVFYGGDQHVAVITSESKPRTFFGGFTQLKNIVGRPTNWTDYMNKEMDTPETILKFNNEAWEIFDKSRCKSQNMEKMPSVVERSGASLYLESRSINDVQDPNINYIRIIHIP